MLTSFQGLLKLLSLLQQLCLCYLSIRKIFFTPAALPLLDFRCVARLYDFLNIQPMLPFIKRQMIINLNHSGASPLSHLSL